MQFNKLCIPLLFLSTLTFTFACDTVDDTHDVFRKGNNGGKPDKGGGGNSVGIESTGDEFACGGKIYACGDTLDNDGDGLVDYADPECTTPCDDAEGSFQTDLPGQNEDCKSDCYFDENTGAGDDKCEQNLKCDREDPGALIGCEYDPEYQTCGIEVEDACQEFCEPLVPNGCDCFGCCEIGDRTVYLDGSPDCHLGNLDACQSCTLNTECDNPCAPEECELCFGQQLADLPDECNGEPACPDGVSACASHSDCPAGDFCQTGCCISFN
jgi:hypothetical protein